MQLVQIKHQILKNFPFLALKKYRIIVIVIVLFSLILLTSYLVPRHYDYSAIEFKTLCDKKPHFDNKFVTFPFKTIPLRAGIGNQLFEVVSLLGMARKLNRTAIFNSNDWYLMGNLDILENYFPELTKKVISMPIVVEQSTRYPFLDTCCSYEFHSIINCEQSKFLVIDGFYFQSYKYFSDVGEEIRNLIVPKTDKNRQRAARQLNQKESSIFKTCVHIRRGDFLSDGMHDGTDSTFAIKYIDLLRRKNGGVVHIFSNDEKWVRENIEKKLDKQRGVQIHDTPVDHAVEDLIFSRFYCDSVLITASSSTFGWWMGFLSKNQNKVYYRDIHETADDVKYQIVEDEFYPPQWNKVVINTEK